MKDKVYGEHAKNYALYPGTEFYTIKELLIYAAERHGDKTAFRFEENEAVVDVGFLQFLSHVNALGTYLHAQGFQRSHIALFGENSYMWIVVYFAVVCGGNVVVPIDKDASPEDLAYYLENSDCLAVFYSDDYADVLEKVPSNINCFNLKDISQMLAKGQQLADDGCTSFLEFEPKPEDLASIVYTSGTTGRPKGVMFSHRNFCADAYGCYRHLISNGPQLLLLPLHHTYGMVTGVFCMLYHGFPLCINRSLKYLLNDFQRYDPQCASVVPLVVEMFYKNIWSTAKRRGQEKRLQRLLSLSRFLLSFGLDLRKVLFQSVLNTFGNQFAGLICGGAPIDEKYISGLYDFGIKVLNGYGITECAPVVSVNREFYMVPGSVGTPLCCNQVKIAENGEVLVMGDNVMLGYYRDPAATERAFSDGWFRTGDLGRMDENGVLYITGRLKNLIILGNGENIPAEEIEMRLYSIPYVKEAVAYGQGNKIVAELFLDEAYPQGKAEIDLEIDRLNQELPLNRNIGKVIVRETEFQKTTTGKIKR